MIKTNQLYRKLIDFKPAERSNYVMYLILLIFAIVSLACTIGMLISQKVLGDAYRGAPSYVAGLLTLLIIAAVALFRRGYFKAVDSLFLLFILLIYANIVSTSGSENEFAILLMVFYIIVAAITLKGKQFFTSIFLLFLCFITLSSLETKGLILPDVANRTNFANVGGTSIILTLIIFISWLFNYEINNYILQLKESKKLLKKERDLLEIKVEERTKQLQKEQVEKMAEFSKFAEFGRLAQGLFHDLMNPLTALSLNLNEIKKDKNDHFSRLNEYIEGATAAANNIEKLIESTRNYFRHKVEKTSFSIIEELNNLHQVMRFKAEKAGVKLVFQNEEDLKIYGNRTRFSQLLGNLVVNAIEAYDQKKTRKSDAKVVVVKFFRRADSVIISVKDSACGMSEKTKGEIFKPFFSTKENRGNTGIGLTMCKDLVETELMGKISVESELGKGTEFVITLPKPTITQ